MARITVPFAPQQSARSPGDSLPGLTRQADTTTTEAEMTMTMACRAITQRQAEHIGMAAAMAGGYVAVNGPRAERMDRDAYRALREDAENDAVRWRREDARRLAAAYHELPSGEYVRIVSHGGYHDHLILVIPPDDPLAEYGYALPPSVVRDLIPLLEAAGYDTGGLL